ncbi:hypothetical protein ACMBCM_09695, partial [Spiroplasma sp. K1]
LREAKNCSFRELKLLVGRPAGRPARSLASLGSWIMITIIIIIIIIIMIIAISSQCVCVCVLFTQTARTLRSL